MTESQFQSAVIELAKLNGYRLIYHTHDSRRSVPGFPDLVLVSEHRQRALFRELNAGVWRPEDLTNGHILHDLRGA